MARWLRRCCVAGVVPALLGVLMGCSPPRAIEAARVIADVAAGDGPSALKTGRPAPVRREIAGQQSGEVLGDLYWPGDQALAALVLVPGAVPQGKDDPRLVAFALTFARARFAVLVPEIPNLRRLHLSAADAEPIAAAIRWLAACTDPTAASVGMIAISYAAGPALLAVLAPEIGPRVRVVMTIGGYFDVQAVVTFFTTGYYRAGPDAPWRYREPNAYGKWVLVSANAARLDDAADQATLAAIATRKLDDPEAEIGDLRARLGAEGRAVMALLDNDDPDQVPERIAALPEGIRRELTALDLADKDLDRLDARLILIHGRDDPIIPSTESEALAAAAAQASLHVVDRLAHVELGPAALGDGLSLWRATYQLLTERDAMPAPDPDACGPFGP